MRLSMCCLLPLLFCGSAQEEKSGKAEEPTQPDGEEEGGKASTELGQEWEEGYQDWDGGKASTEPHQEWKQEGEEAQEWEAPDEQEWEAADHEQEWEAPQEQEWAKEGEEAPQQEWKEECEEAAHGQEWEEEKEDTAHKQEWEESEEALQHDPDWDEEGNWIGSPAVPTPTSGETDWYETGHWDPEQNAREIVAEDWVVDKGSHSGSNLSLQSACAGLWMWLA